MPRAVECDQPLHPLYPSLSHCIVWAEISQILFVTHERTVCCLGTWGRSRWALWSMVSHAEGGLELRVACIQQRVRLDCILALVFLFRHRFLCGCRGQACLVVKSRKATNHVYANPLIGWTTTSLAI